MIELNNVFSGGKINTTLNIVQLYVVCIEHGDRHLLTDHRVWCCGQHQQSGYEGGHVIAHGTGCILNERVESL